MKTHHFETAAGLTEGSRWRWWSWRNCSRKANSATACTLRGGWRRRSRRNSFELKICWTFPGIIILPHFRETKQYTNMVILRDFPYCNALFGLVNIMTPDFAVGTKRDEDFFVLQEIEDFVGVHVQIWNTKSEQWNWRTCEDGGNVKGNLSWIHILFSGSETKIRQTMRKLQQKNTRSWTQTKQNLQIPSKNCRCQAGRKS